MRFPDLFAASREALTRRWSRTLLTMLGMVIGIAAVVVMLAIGRGAEGFILGQVADLGSDSMFIEPSAGDPTDGPPDPFIEQTLTLRDADELAKSPWFASVAPMVVSTVPVSYGQESRFTQVAGVNAAYLDSFPAPVALGRFVDDDDVRANARVVVLGEHVAEELFGVEDPVGKSMKIDGVRMRVIGVMGRQGTKFFQNLDDRIVVPVGTAMRDVFGTDRLSFIALRSAPGVNMERAKEEARFLLRDAHDIDNPQDDVARDDFRVSSQEDALKTIGAVGTALSVLLASVASISLVVGGVGIMNIMLVSVSERTREIGLRKAVGARAGDIQKQFLLETLLLAGFAGVLGTGMGIALAWLSGQAASHFVEGWHFVIPWNGVVAGVVMSTVIGLVFGVYPARRAAKLDPITALRVE